MASATGGTARSRRRFLRARPPSPHSARATRGEPLDATLDGDAARGRGARAEGGARLRLSRVVACGHVGPPRREERATRELSPGRGLSRQKSRAPRRARPRAARQARYFLRAEWTVAYGMMMRALHLITPSLIYTPAPALTERPRAMSRARLARAAPCQCLCQCPGRPPAVVCRRC